MIPIVQGVDALRMVLNGAVNDGCERLDSPVFGHCRSGADALRITETGAQKKNNLTVGHVAKSPGRKYRRAHANPNLLASRIWPG